MTGDTDSGATPADAAAADTVRRLEAEVQRLLVENRQLRLARDRLVELEAESVSLNERAMECDIERARNAELLRILDAMYRSSSWRVTQPMRKAVDFVRTTAVDAVRQVRPR